MVGRLSPHLFPLPRPYFPQFPSQPNPFKPYSIARMLLNFRTVSRKSTLIDTLVVSYYFSTQGRTDHLILKNLHRIKKTFRYGYFLFIYYDNRLNVWEHGLNGRYDFSRRYAISYRIGQLAGQSNQAVRRSRTVTFSSRTVCTRLNQRVRRP